jgi:hypothetical protein
MSRVVYKEYVEKIHLLQRQRLMETKKEEKQEPVLSYSD